LALVIVLDRHVAGNETMASTKFENRFDLDGIFNEQNKNFYHFQTTTPTSKDDQKKLVDEEIPCPSCGSHDIFYDQASTICRNCGIVIDDSLPESRHGWRVFTEEDKKKIHAEKSRIDSKYTTRMQNMTRDYTGKMLAPEMRAKMSRIQKKDKSSQDDKEERALRQSANRIRVLCGKLRLTDNVRDSSIMFFKKYAKNCLNNNFKGKCIESFSLAVVYKACKEARAPFKLEEIAKQMKVDTKKIRGYYIQIMQNTRKDRRKMSVPTEYVPRIGSALKMDNESTMTMHNWLNDLMNHPEYKSMSMGKESIGYAAAAAYLACIRHGLKPLRNRETVAALTSVAESTIKKRAEEMIVALDIDIEHYFNKFYKKYSEQHVNRFKRENDD
jgi:transcription initiation factor TFIIB